MPKRLSNLAKIKSPGERHSVAGAKDICSDILRCPKCLAYYYKKSWHDQSLSLEQLARLHCMPGSVKSLECPACSMVRKGRYEGKVVIKHVPRDLQRLLLSSLIKLFGINSYERDCQHRLIEIDERQESITVTTTENHLAVRLAKKVKEIFKKVHILIRRGGSSSNIMVATVDFNAMPDDYRK